MSLLDIENVNMGNHIQNIIFEYIKDFGIFGIAPPLWINREFVPGNIKCWTERDWDDVLKESDQYYVFVKLHKHVHTINIYKRNELSIDENKSYHPIYIVEINNGMTSLKLSISSILRRMNYGG
jgi:hypothetical protein